MNPRIFGLMIIARTCAPFAPRVEAFCAESADRFPDIAVEKETRPGLSSMVVMRFFPLCCLVALSLAPMAGRGQESTATRSSGNAFDAVRLLSPEQQAGLAIIAGRDGSPLPERWHLLVHDTAAENGLREFVVSRGRIVASRTVSQFAETLSREQVFAPESLKVDTDRVSRLAEEFGRANGVTIAAIHYDLRRTAPDGAPLWTAFCTNSSGQELGKTILNASTGAIISHPGFAISPSLEAGP